MPQSLQHPEDNAVTGGCSPIFQINNCGTIQPYMLGPPPNPIPESRAAPSVPLNCPDTIDEPHAVGGCLSHAIGFGARNF